MLLIGIDSFPLTTQRASPYLGDVSSSALNANFRETTEGSDGAHLAQLGLLEYGNPTPDMELRMRSNVCTLILAAASLAPSALLAQPLDPAAGGATITATAPGKGVAERVAQITASV